MQEKVAAYIQNELKKLMDEYHGNTQQIKELEELKNELIRRNEQISAQINEGNMLQRAVESAQTINLVAATETKVESKNQLFHDALHKIFARYGNKALRMGLIIDELAIAGFTWSCYQSAYSALTDKLEKSEKRGHYRYVS